MNEIESKRQLLKRIKEFAKKATSSEIIEMIERMGIELEDYEGPDLKPKSLVCAYCKNEFESMNDIACCSTCAYKTGC